MHAITTETHHEWQDKVKALELEMLKLPQADCPVRHTFMPGIYMREVTIPAGVLAVGHFQRFNHINIMVKGRVVVLNDNGTTSELVAPLTFIGSPGRKCGYVLEDMVWINVHYATSTDVQELEDMLYDKSGEPAQVQVAHDTSIDAVCDYLDVLTEWGLSEDLVQEEIQRTEGDVLPMPYGMFKMKIAESPIHGKGVFATGDIAAGEVVGPATVHGQRTPIGRYTNHSNEPNAAMQLVNGDAYLVALRDIGGCKGGLDGEELTTDYRENLKLVGRVQCQG